MTVEKGFTRPVYLRGCQETSWTRESYSKLYEAVRQTSETPEIEMIFISRLKEQHEIRSSIDTLQAMEKSGNDCYQLIVTENLLEHEQIILLQHYVHAVVSSKYLRTYADSVAEAIERRAEHLEPETVIRMVEILENKRERRKPIQRLILDQKKANEIFSAGEMEIIQAILDGRKNTQICEDIYKAKSTVYSILSKILQKLEVENRTQIIAECIKRKWLISIRE